MKRRKHDVKLPWWPTLIESSWTISHVSWLKIASISGTISIPITTTMMCRLMMTEILLKKDRNWWTLVHIRCLFYPHLTEWDLQWKYGHHQNSKHPMSLTKYGLVSHLQQQSHHAFCWCQCQCLYQSESLIIVPVKFFFVTKMLSSLQR
jgi:hypothetical protein